TFENFKVGGTEFNFSIVAEGDGGYALKIELQGEDYYFVPKADGGEDNPGGGEQGGEDNPGDEPSVVDTSAFAGVYIEDLSQYGSSGRLDPENREGGRLIINDDGTARLYYFDAEGEYEYSDGLIIEGDVGGFVFYDANGAYVATENGEENPGETGNDIRFLFSFSQEGVYKLELFDGNNESLYFYTLEDIYNSQGNEDEALIEQIAGTYQASVPERQQTTYGTTARLSIGYDGNGMLSFDNEDLTPYLGSFTVTGENQITFTSEDKEVSIVLNIDDNGNLVSSFDGGRFTFVKANGQGEDDKPEGYPQDEIDKSYPAGVTDYYPSFEVNGASYTFEEIENQTYQLVVMLPADQIPTDVARGYGELLLKDDLYRFDNGVYISQNDQIQITLQATEDSSVLVTIQYLFEEGNVIYTLNHVPAEDPWDISGADAQLYAYVWNNKSENDWIPLEYNAEEDTYYIEISNTWIGCKIVRFAPGSVIDWATGADGSVNEGVVIWNQTSDIELPGKTSIINFTLR
ncbi:MAG: hypothetical protein K5925_04435, partial [Bacilli bacterium]|nr:hypothetical protein [Bacilli bacterium]